MNELDLLTHNRAGDAPALEDTAGLRPGLLRFAASCAIKPLFQATIYNLRKTEKIRIIHLRDRAITSASLNCVTNPAMFRSIASAALHTLCS